MNGAYSNAMSTKEELLVAARGFRKRRRRAILEGYAAWTLMIVGSWGVVVFVGLGIYAVTR